MVSEGGGGGNGRTVLGEFTLKEGLPLFLSLQEDYRPISLDIPCSSSSTPGGFVLILQHKIESLDTFLIFLMSADRIYIDRHVLVCVLDMKGLKSDQCNSTILHIKRQVLLEL